MTDRFDAMNPVSRQAVEAFLDFYRYREHASLKGVFAEDCVMEGAFTGGLLRGRSVVEAHLRQVSRRILDLGIMRVHNLSVTGQQVVIDWELDCPGEIEAQSTRGVSILDLDEQGLIKKLKAVWNPMALKAWKEHG